MNINNSSVYCITCKVNNKKYFGVTSLSVEERTKGFKNYRGRIKQDIAKYGKDNFKVDTLYSNINREEALKLEHDLIIKYKTNNIEYGYNITSGNEKDKLSNDNRHHSKEQKQNISIATKKAMNTEERRKYMRNVYDSKEWRSQNSEDTKKQWQNTDLRKRVQEANGTKIICDETQEVFLSIHSASIALGVSDYVIQRQLKGIIKDYDVYHFRKYENK